jgi:signal transduction histidine kinase
VSRVSFLRRPLLGDVLLAAVLTVLSVITLAESAGDVSAATAVLVPLAVAPLAVRQQAPVLSMSVILVALAAWAVLDQGEFPSNAIGLVIATFTVAMLCRRAVALVMLAAAIAVVGLAYAFTEVEGLVWTQVAQAAVTLLVAWLLGDSARRWSRRAERAAAAAERAVAEERLRIARELHDVVSHHMSVISLQAGLAAYVIDTDVPTARRAITTAGDAGREALLEMRRMLGALRTDGDTDEAAGYHPQPGLAQLDGLVDRVRDAGLDVDVEVTGAVRELPPGPDLCAYRVVQESLTNVLKHAGPATARVAIDYGEHTMTVTVSDDGTGAAAGRNGAPVDAHGIKGMRERSELYGGVLVAGPAPAGGFTVRLRLPIGELG